MSNKSAAAQKVLEAMDDTDDGPDRFTEILLTVSIETGVSTEKIKKELEDFI